MQSLADSRFHPGDKSDGRLYLHYIHPVFGYSMGARRWVSRKLGIQKKRPYAQLDDFVRLSEHRAFRSIAHGVKVTDGKIKNKMTGQILYVLGTLVHTHQDRKHMEGNWTDYRGDGISSPEHFTTEIHQLFSDMDPPKDMESRALLRTAAFLARFKKDLRRRVGKVRADRALKRLRDFSMARGRQAQHYKPPVKTMRYIFPEYPVAQPPPILTGPL